MITFINSNKVNTPIQKDGKRPMLVEDMVEYGENPTSLTIYAPKENSHVYFRNKEGIDVVPVEVPGGYAELNPLKKAVNASEKASDSRPTKASESQPDVLVDMQIFKTGNDIRQFQRGMLESGFANIYLHNDQLFDPKNDVMANIEAGIQLFVMVQDLKMKITNAGGGQVHATSPNPLAEAALVDCGRLCAAYEKYKEDATKNNDIVLNRDKWLKSSEVSSSAEMRHLNAIFTKPEPQPGQVIQPPNRTITLDHIELIEGVKKPTSLLIFAANGSSTAYKKDESVHTTIINVDKGYVPPGEGGQPVKYTEQRKEHLKNYEPEHNQKMESINNIISNIEKKINSLISNYKDTKIKGLGWFAKNKNNVATLKQEFGGIANNLEISPQEKLMKMMNLMMKYYSPKDGKVDFETTLNKEKSDHYFKRSLGLTMQAAYGALKSVEDNKVTLPEKIERVSKLTIPETSVYDSFRSDIAQGKESPRMGRNSNSR